MPRKENRTEGGGPLAERGRHDGHGLPMAGLAAAAVAMAEAAAGETGMARSAAARVGPPCAASCAARSARGVGSAIHAIVKVCSSQRDCSIGAVRACQGRPSGARGMQAGGTTRESSPAARVLGPGGARESGFGAAMCKTCVPNLVFFFTDH